MQKHRLFIIVLLVVVLTLGVSCKLSDKNDIEPETSQDPAEIDEFIELDLDYDDIMREAILYIPENLPMNAPIVFVLHGYTGTSEHIMNETGMNRIADKNGFAVCYPQGLPAETGSTHWNAWLSISEVDDIGFLSALAKYLHDKYNFDEDRTFCCGFSNGGFMSYTLAVERPDIFKAIASVSGTMSGQLWKKRDDAVPVPVMHIHGADDYSVPIDGNMSSKGGWGGAPAIRTIINFWADLNECTSAEAGDFSPDTTAYYYKEGIRGNEVWYFEIEDWAHQWPGEEDKDISDFRKTAGINASEKIWEFFSRYK